MKAQHLVLGLSAFGEALIEELLRGGAKVYAVDRDPGRVRRWRHRRGVTAVRADATSEEALHAVLEGAPVQHAVVAIRGDFLAAERAAEILRDLREKHPGRLGRITIATNHPHRWRIARSLSHEVVSPELRVAPGLATTMLDDEAHAFHHVASDEEGEILGVAEIPLRGGGPFDASRLEAAHPGARVLGFRRYEDGPLIPPGEEVWSGWLLVIFLAAPRLGALRAWLAEHFPAPSPAEDRP